MSPQERHSPEHEELVALYALGMLEGDERDALEAHLADCAQCRRGLARRRGEVVMLAELVDPEEPSAAVRDSFRRSLTAGAAGTGGAAGTVAATADSDVARVAADDPDAAAEPTVEPTVEPIHRRQAESRSAAPLWPWALAAVLLLAVGWSWMEQRSLHDELEWVAQRNQALEAELDRSTGELNDLRSRLASTRAALSAVSAEPLAVLAGLEGAADARGRVYHDPHSGQVLVAVADLPEAPGDRVYQVWGIVGGQPVSAGVFDTDVGGGTGFLVAAPPEGEVDTWAITEEPAGGVPQPTGAMVLKS